MVAAMIYNSLKNKGVIGFSKSQRKPCQFLEKKDQIMKVMDKPIDHVQRIKLEDKLELINIVIRATFLQQRKLVQAGKYLGRQPKKPPFTPTFYVIQYYFNAN